MQVFKAALKVLFKHPIYLCVYVLWLSAMAAFIGLSAGSADTPAAGFEQERPEIAIIDRDASAVSGGVADFLKTRGDEVRVADDERSLQDAIAQGRVDYIAIIPAGFGSEFEKAAATGAADVPIIQTSASFGDMASRMMDSLLDEYLGLARVNLMTGSMASEAMEQAGEAMGVSAQVEVYSQGEAIVPAEGFRYFMLFSSYTCMVAIIVLVGVTMKAFNASDMRKRNQASACSALSMNLQVVAACVVAALVVVLWQTLLGTVVFYADVVAIGTQVYLLSVLNLFVYALVALSFGFLFGSISDSEMVMNAGGNILGLVFSFMGGVWMPLDLMGTFIQTVARFIPSFYFSEAVGELFCSGPAFWPNVGMQLLFAVAIVAIALVASRAKRQTTVRVNPLQPRAQHLA